MVQFASQRGIRRDVPGERRGRRGGRGETPLLRRDSQTAQGDAHASRPAQPETPHRGASTSESQTTLEHGWNGGGGLKKKGS